VIGTNLILGSRSPKNTDEIAWIRVTELGPAPRSTDGAEVTAKSIQIVGHGRTYMEGRKITDDLIQKLLNQACITISGYTILSIVGDEPQYLGVSEKNQEQFVSNLIVRYKKGA
jgi:hypothetical protein